MTRAKNGGHRGTPVEVFRAFLRLGLNSFGGPIAHLGYFRREFVERRQWIDEDEFGDVVALCQFLPGPTSSQVGFLLGFMRAGPVGAIAAFVAFTLPSAVLLTAFAFSSSTMQGVVSASALHSLHVVAAVAVAAAVWGMARTLCPDRQRIGVAIVAALLVTIVGGLPGQLAAIGVGAIGGFVFYNGLPAVTALENAHVRFSKSVAVAALALYALLLVLLPIVTVIMPSTDLKLANAFFRSGALVFGGGHVVLPLLHAALVDGGMLGNEALLSGYGAAQAVPGPLFSIAAYLGAATTTGWGRLGRAIIGLLTIFLPGFLVLSGVLPFWTALRHRPGAQAVLRGVNAAVVGVLASALYSPIATTAIRDVFDAFFVVLGFAALATTRVPPFVVVFFLVGSVTAFGVLRAGNGV